VCARVEDINQTVIFPLLDGSGFVRKRQLACIIRYRNFGSLVDPLNYYRYYFASFFRKDQHNAILQKVFYLYRENVMLYVP